MTVQGRVGHLLESVIANDHAVVKKGGGGGIYEQMLVRTRIEVGYAGRRAPQYRELDSLLKSKRQLSSCTIRLSTCNDFVSE